MRFQSTKTDQHQVQWTSAGIRPHFRGVWLQRADLASGGFVRQIPPVTPAVENITAKSTPKNDVLVTAKATISDF